MIINKENICPSLTPNEKSLTKRKSSIQVEPQCIINDYLSLSYWDLPDKIIKKYNEIGVERMFEWQAECLQCGQALMGKNLIYSAPTSAGKTLVAELLMLKRVLETRKKAIMVLPFVSVAREKMKHLQWFASDLNIKIDGFIGNNNPSGGFSSVDIAICTIEKANSLINRLIEEDKVSDLSVLVIDELHMIGDSSRGYLLELLLTKIKYLTTKFETKNSIQIIGMSATLPNLDLLSSWLNASLYQTNFRPIPLVECIKFENKIFDNSFKLLKTIQINDKIEQDADQLLNLTYETMSQKLGVLVFCPTKSRCEAIAESIAKMNYKLDKLENGLSYLNKEKIISIIEQLKRTPAGLDSQLGKCISYGVAFHHAGLTAEEREIVENSFKEGSILVIVATSTLSSGVNLPARRVIIRTPCFNGHLLDTMTYRQMIGRAGRKGIDTQGESILMCNNSSEKRQGEELVKSTLPPIKSCLLSSTGNLSLSIKRAVLEIIVSGIAREINDVRLYTSCTLLCVSSNEQNQIIDATIEQSIKWLLENELIAKVSIKEEEIDKEIFKATPFGSAVLNSAMSPDEGLVIFSELQKALQCFVLTCELHIIYEITPINISEYWQTSSAKLDWSFYLSIIENLDAEKKRVASLVGIRESFIMKMVRGKPISTDSDRKSLKIHFRFYTALILNDLVNEVPFSELTKKYDCQKGFLQSLQQSSATYAAMITIFCNRLGWYNLEILVSQFQSRLIFGVQRELCDLIRISLLNSYRARLIYNNGITNISALATADPHKIEKILEKSTYFNPNVDGSKKFDVKSIWNDGKSYTNWEAANKITEEAKILLRKDVEQLGLKLADEKDKFEVSDSLISDFNSPKIKDNSINECKKNSDFITPKLTEEINEKAKESKIETPKIKFDHVNVEKSKSCVVQPKSVDTKKILHEEVSTPIATKAYKEFDTGHIEENIQDVSLSMSLMSIDDSELAAAFAIASQLSRKPKSIKEKEIQESQTESQLDNQNMIELVNRYELRSKTPKKTQTYKTPTVNKIESRSKSSKNVINTTIISDDVIQLCEMYEQKLPKTPLMQTVKDDVKWKTPNVIQSPRITAVEKTKVSNTSIESSNKVLTDSVRKLLALLPTSIVSNYTIDEVKTLIDLNKFTETIKKVKNLISVSLGCETYAKEKLQEKYSFNIMKNIAGTKEDSIDEKADFFLYHDKEKSLNLRVSSICFSYLVNSKKVQVYVIYFNNLNKKECFECLQQVFAIETSPKIMFSAKEQFKLIAKIFDFEIESSIFDPLIAYWLLEGKIGSINDIKLKYSANSFDVELDNYLKTCKFSYGCQLNTPNSNNDLVKFSFIESIIGLSCIEKLKLKLQIENLWKYYTKIESDILVITAKMELNGLGFDERECQSQTKIIHKRQYEIEKKIFSFINGRHISLTSPDEVARLLYVDLKLQPIVDSRATAKRGNRIKHHSTAKQVLEKLSDQHEVPRLILQWRQIKNGLTNTIHPIENAKCFHQNLNMYRIHSTGDMFTANGRIILNDPCLQMIPKDFEILVPSIDFDDEDGLNDSLNDYCIFENSFNSTDQTYHVSLRNVFVPRKGYLFLAADYCQLELRVISHLSGDKVLQQIMNETKIDVFVLLASKWLGLNVNEVNDTHRQQTKQIVYGIIYGIGPKTLHKILNVSEAEALHFIETFKAKFVGLKQFIHTQIELCRKNGYVETIKKRRRYLPHINSSNHHLKAQAERQAINTIVQGSATDFVKIAMIKIDKELKKKYSAGINNFVDREESNKGAFLVLQMHDELVYEVPENDLNDVHNIVKYNMENCMNFDVKMPVKVKFGQSWGSMKA